MAALLWKLLVSHASLKEAQDQMTELESLRSKDIRLHMQLNFVHYLECVA